MAAAVAPVPLAVPANAVPIAAGFVIFGEQLPGGAKGAVQLAAFASLVASAVLLAHPQAVPAGDSPSAAPSTPHALTGGGRR